MYGEVNPATVYVPVVATAGTAAMLPQTGANAMVSVAVALLAGLVAWGVVYYYRTVRG